MMGIMLPCLDCSKTASKVAVQSFRMGEGVLTSAECIATCKNASIGTVLCK